MRRYPVFCSLVLAAEPTFESILGNDMQGNCGIGHRSKGSGHIGPFGMAELLSPA